MRPSSAVLGLVTLVASVGASACANKTPNDSWPRQPVRLIVPFSAGTGVDLAARLFAERLAERWRQRVVVDNRPGSDGTLGTRVFVSARDDHTLLFAAAGPLTIAPHLHEQLGYDPARDVVPIAAAGSVTLVIALSRSVPATTVKELVALVRAHPRRYRWAASPGGPELVLAALAEQERLDMPQVRYRETSIALQDLAAGRVHMMVVSLPTVAALVQAGSVRLLAVTNTARSRALPNVPTVTEAGLPALTLDGLWGFFGWRGMPDELRDRLAVDVRDAAMDGTMRERLAAVGLALDAGTPAEFAALVEQQGRQAAALVRFARPGARGNPNEAR